MTEKTLNGRTLRTQAPYTSFPLELLKADKAIVLKTGEEVQLTEMVKIVYVYMRNMYCLMLDTPSSAGYFEGWETIAANIGKSSDIFKKGVNRPDKVLEKIGLLEQKRSGKGRASLKVVKDIVEVEGYVVFCNSKVEGHKKRVESTRIRSSATIDTESQTKHIHEPEPSYDFDYLSDTDIPF